MATNTHRARAPATTTSQLVRTIPCTLDLESTTAFPQHNNIHSPFTKKSRTHPYEFAHAPTIVYKQLSLRVPEFGVPVPIADWYYPRNDEDATNNAAVVLQPAHTTTSIASPFAALVSPWRAWDFIPDFVFRDYSMAPPSSTTA